ncbi:DUF2726 domain-containing protein [Trichlorobacter ammonificans]|uniref:DUF2726 domain-containing protein n=1 Tax=Trichlorobacter ammonificans TaxID=2916410 RepID=A0ABM9D8X7_9BACT|nr:DUF2726 domain-containing protein [Trichlorobacter ammonificans]CAH2031685.1 conserved protein of unknown function [Trichlorobacter ammonificans]
MATLSIVLVLILFAGLLLILKTVRSSDDEQQCYVSRSILFTAAERSFLGVLEQALDGSPYRAFGKVNLADMVRPAPGLSPRERAIAKNRIDRKHVDFVICTRADLAIVGVVELDDRSHEREDRIARDALVDRVLAQAGIPVLHVPAKLRYALQELREHLTELLPDLTVTPPRPAAREATAPQQASAAETADALPARPQEPLCPSCSSVMVKRQATKGKYAGKWFWACSTFPDCRQVVALDPSLLRSDTAT